MENSNEKSKECCELCEGNHRHFTGEARVDCKCHKPSVEVSKCCGAEKIESATALFRGGVCSKCGGYPFEPQSIPLERKCNCVLINHCQHEKGCNYASDIIDRLIDSTLQTESEERNNFANTTPEELDLITVCVPCFNRKHESHDSKIVCNCDICNPIPNLTPESKKLDQTKFEIKWVEPEEWEPLITPESTEMEEWEKSFDKEFVSSDGTYIPDSNLHLASGDVINVPTQIKQFISNLLSSQSQKLKEKIEKVKEEVRTQTGSFKYDSCYDDCINIINNIK